MTTTQHDAFMTLQNRWVQHQELRSQGASIAELAASRAALDSARLQSARVLANA